MKLTDLEIRHARPGDAGVASRLIYQSGPDAFRFVFGSESEALRFLEYAFEHKEGEFGYGCHTVGLLDGVVVAIGALLDGRETLKNTIAAVKQFVGCFGPLGWIPVAVRGLRTEAVIQPPKKGEVALVHITVEESLRGKGIGKAIIARLLEEVNRMSTAGAQSLPVLDVAAHNAGAEHVYTSLGFRVQTERISNLRNAAGHVPAHKRMIRA